MRFKKGHRLYPLIGKKGFRHPLVGMVAICLVTLGLASAPSTGNAHAQEESSVVFAVLFYSPTCPHCAIVIEEVLPTLEEEFGDRLQLLLINTASPEGQALVFSAYDAFNVPDEHRGVPTFVIGSTVLVGSVDIPQLAPGLIREGLEAGGIGLPAIPGLREAYEMALNNAPAVTDPSSNIPPDGGSDNGSNLDPESESEPNPGYQPDETLTEIDPIGVLSGDAIADFFALAVLIGLGTSLGVVVAAGARHLARNDQQPLDALLGSFGRWSKVGSSGAAFALSATLVSQPEERLATPIAIGMAFGLAIISVVLWNAAAGNPSEREPAIGYPGLIALTAIIGLIDAAYLAYAETSGTTAACGLVGDCNIVQQSSYAVLFGFLPLGVLGVIGNLAILVALLISRVARGTASELAIMSIFAMSIFGCVFSIYLTILEIFVIRAVCVWCLTSATLMMLLLWLSAPPGLEVLRRRSWSAGYTQIK